MGKVNFSDFCDFPVIISPNLGKPSILTKFNQSNPKKHEYFSFLICVAPSSYSKSEIESFLENNLFVEALLLMDEGSSKYKRGTKIQLKILWIDNEIPKKLDEREFLNSLFIENRFETIDEKVLDQNPFVNRDSFYLVKYEFQLSEEAKKILTKRSLVMFDLIQKFPKAQNDLFRINYHAIVVSEKEWIDYRFVHITDLHIAKRNDEILGVIKGRMNSGFGSKIIGFFDKISSREKEEEKPIEKRFQNPNNSLRLFNRWANIEMEQRNLDFVVITGDILDFCVKADKSDKDSDFLEFKSTNWDVFVDIITGNRPILREDYSPVNLLEEQELGVPIFTATGNHDVRLFRYAITLLEIYKLLGLHYLEANLYFDLFGMAPVTALIISQKALNPYFQFINPYNNYMIKLGSNSFIFLNSGADEFLEFKSLLMADPSSTGFSDSQYTFCSEILNKIDTTHENKQIFLLSHAPMLNPIIKKSIRTKLLSKLKLIREPDISDTKERKLIEFGMKDPRADEDVEFFYGTISNNWVKFLGLTHTYKIIHLCGHTHKKQEFRIERTDNPTVSYSGNGEKILLPFAVYWDDYSEFYTQEDIQKNRPLHIQTASLGIGRYTEKKLKGAFRIFEIKNNKLHKIQNCYLSEIFPEIDQ